MLALIPFPQKAPSAPTPSHWVKTWPESSTQAADDDRKLLKLANKLKPTGQPLVTSFQAVLVAFRHPGVKCQGVGGFWTQHKRSL